MQVATSFYDALVIGAGPAGLAAAMSLARACRTVAVFDSQEYRNEKAQFMQNVLCHDGEKPSTFRARAMEQMDDKYDTISFIDTPITGARHVMSEKRPYFELTSQKGSVWRGRKLILASGTKDVLPSIKGYADLWGRGIVHCIFCHGFEHRGGHIGYLGLDDPHHLAPILASFSLAADGVTVFTNGASPDSSNKDVQKAKDIAVARGANFDDRPIESISKNLDGEGIQIHFADGTEKHLNMLLNSPPTVNRAQNLIESLGLEVQQGADNYVVSKNPMGETSLPGCFAAGDTSTVMRSVAVACSTGSMAGAGAALQLAIDEGAEALRELVDTA